MPVVTPEELEVAETEQSSSETKRRLHIEQAYAHLSNERTFLAWIWTGIMLMGFSVVVANMHVTSPRNFFLSGASLPSHGNYEISTMMIGMVFLAAGVLTILTSACRYLVIQNKINNQIYTISDNSILVFLLILSLASVALIVLIVPV